MPNQGVVLDKRGGWKRERGVGRGEKVRRWEVGPPQSRRGSTTSLKAASPPGIESCGQGVSRGFIFWRARMWEWEDDSLKEIEIVEWATPPPAPSSQPNVRGGLLVPGTWQFPRQGSFSGGVASLENDVNDVKEMMANGASKGSLPAAGWKEWCWLGWSRKQAKKAKTRWAEFCRQNFEVKSSKIPCIWPLCKGVGQNLDLQKTDANKIKTTTNKCKLNARCA